MNLRIGCLVAMILLVPSAVSAQTVETPHPDYTASIALHISAATVGIGATGCLFVGAVMALGSAIGGSSGTTDPAQVPLLLSGAIGLLVAIGMGIAATVVHVQTRNARARDTASSASLLPLAWLDANGAGAGVSLTL